MSAGNPVLDVRDAVPVTHGLTSRAGRGSLKPSPSDLGPFRAFRLVRGRGTMAMYAVVTEVQIDTARLDEAAKLLEEFTIPRARQTPGFLRGTWIRSEDGARGRGLLLYEDKDAARAASELISQGPPPGSPARLSGVEVFEVVGQAQALVEQTRRLSFLCGGAAEVVASLASMPRPY